MRRFARFHSISLVSYFTILIVVMMITTNPVLQVISFCSSLICFVVTNHNKNVIKEIIYYFVLFVLTSITNPLFSHNGKTPLFFMNANPVTLEAVLKGISIATTLISVILWLNFCGNVLTSEKILQLFGRFSPKLSLIFSMTLQFIPTFRRKFNQTEDSLKSLGIFSCESRFDRVRLKLRVFGSVLMNFAENSVEISDSMNARGYGLKGRTSYNVKKFNKGDCFILLYSFAVLVGFLVNELNGKLIFEYYPSVSYFYIDFGIILLYVSYFILCFLPIYIEILENVKWKFLVSKI